MDELGARVVEIEGANLREVKNQAVQLPEVQSAAQQGLRLRILFKPGVENPTGYLNEHLPSGQLTVTQARPSLEDVFVAATSENRQ